MPQARVRLLSDVWYTVSLISSKAWKDKQRIGVDELHKHAMARLVNRFGNRKAMLMKDLYDIGNTSREAQADGPTFMKAHSFCADSRERYIQEADLRLPM